MEKKNNSLIIILMGVIIVILAMLCVLFATDIISFKSNEIVDESNNKDIVNQENNLNDNNNQNKITEENIVKIIEEELFIFFMHSEPNRKIEDLDNQSKLYMALIKMENDYIRKDNEIHAEIETFSKKGIEEYFNSSCLSTLTFSHEDIAEFKYDSDRGMYDNSHLMSKIGYKYMYPHAKKVVDFKEDNNTYSISIKYLFPDDSVGNQYYYGDLEYKNKIVKAYDENNNYIDAQKYLDENYESIKDKLATYNYTFKYENNKLNLVDFSIN